MSRRKQTLVFLITYLTYAVYYLTRKNLSVAKSRLTEDLGVSMTMLGSIDACYLSFYALGLFVNGALGDRFGAKKILVLGLVGSGVCSILFGISHTSLVFALLFGLNGFFQSAGWPASVKVMTPWFAKASRGKVMGLWSTNYQVGGLVATMLASFFLMHFGWREAFMAPGLIVALMGVVVWLLLPTSDKASAFKPQTWRSDYVKLIKKPEIWCLGFSYFGFKIIRYSLLFWLPFYLHRILKYSEDTAAYLSLATEIGGIFGAIFVGVIADRFMPINRGRMVLPLAIALSFCLLLYQQVGSLGVMPNFIAMTLVGFFLFGPDILISGACAQDVGGELSSSAAGFINGIGSLGGIIQGFITVYISESFGWHILFYFFALVAILAGVATIPIQMSGLRAKVLS